MLGFRYLASQDPDYDMEEDEKIMSNKTEKNVEEMDGSSTNSRKVGDSNPPQNNMTNNNQEEEEKGDGAEIELRGENDQNEMNI